MTHISARQLAWTTGNEVERLADEFEVDHLPEVAGSFPNPSVAFSQSSSREGQFVVMWNAINASSRAEVRARAFDSDGAALGTEFRVNVATDTTTDRKLAPSAQHTCAWSAQDRITATWAAGSSSSGQVYVTTLPPGFIEQRCAAQECCRGDLSGDGFINGVDIYEYWVKYLANPPNFPTGACRGMGDFCALDINGDCRWVPEELEPGSDWPGFVCLLLNPICGACAEYAVPNTECCMVQGESQAFQMQSSSSCTFVTWADCNDNGIADETDIATAASADCNQNAWPDECDVAFNSAVFDINRNLIPDECEQGIGATQSATAAPSMANADIVQEMVIWKSTFNHHGLKAWEIAYAIKMKFAELGVFLGSSGMGGTQ